MPLRLMRFSRYSPRLCARHAAIRATYADMSRAMMLLRYSVTRVKSARMPCRRFRLRLLLIITRLLIFLRFSLPLQMLLLLR